MKKLFLFCTALMASVCLSAATQTVETTMEELVNSNGYSLSTNDNVTPYTTVPLDSYITMSTSGSGQCGSFWKASNVVTWRLYQTNGGDITFRASSGATITSVTITYLSTNNGALYDGSSSVVSNETQTVGSTSVTYTVSSPSGTNGQVRIKAVKVEYELGNTGETDEFYYLPMEGDYCSNGMFSSSSAIAVPANEQFINGTAFDVYNAFETTYRTVGMLASGIDFGAVVIDSDFDKGMAAEYEPGSYHIQGQVNPKTSKNENLFTAMEAPVSGSCYKVVLHKSGYLYAAVKSTPNKTPFIYNTAGGYYVGCKFLSKSINTTGSSFGNPDGVICVEYKGDDANNRLLTPPSKPCEVVGGTYDVMGIGVVCAYLPAGTYLVGSDGSKMMAVGFGFSEDEEDVYAQVVVNDQVTTVQLNDPSILYTQECLTQTMTTNFIDPKFLMFPEETQQLQINRPTGFENATFAWSSSDNSVLTVSNTGLVSALEFGHATITATATVAGVELTATMNIEVVDLYGNYQTVFTMSYPEGDMAGQNVVATCLLIPGWLSDNMGKDGSMSKWEYNIYMDAGDKLNFTWAVSSESGYDYLTITIDGDEKIKASGEQEDEIEYVATQSKTVVVEVAYTKDAGSSSGQDMAGISNIYRFFGEPIVMSAVEEIAINQETLKAIDIAESAQLQTISYTRTYGSTWEPLYLPFEMPASKWSGSLEVARINGFYQYDNDEDGTIDETVLEVIRMPKTADLQANYPYLVRAEKETTATITLENAWLAPTLENSFDCATFTDRFIFTGTYQEMTAGAISGMFILQDGMLKPATMTSVLAPCSWYMDVETRTGALLTAPMRICVHNEDEPSTNIQNAQAGKQANKFIKNGSLYIQREGAIYNATGIKMKTK